MNTRVDEAASLPLHRFLSMARLLMHLHPRRAAILYSTTLGMPQLKPGWNELRASNPADTKYIFIGEGTGRTTRTRPRVPDQEINVVIEDQLRLVVDTSAWWELERFAARVAETRPHGLGADWVDEIKAAIRAAGDRPLGLDPAVDERIQNELKDLQLALREPEVSLMAFVAPVQDILEDYACFRLTRSHAANILAVLFLQFIKRFPSPLRMRSFGDVLQKHVDHLIAVMSELAEERWSYDLGSFHHASYLANLTAETVTVTCNGLRIGAPPEVQQWLADRGRYADEFAAHELMPALSEPHLMFPANPTEALAALADARGGGKRPRHYADTVPQNVDRKNLAEVWEAVAAHSHASTKQWPGDEHLAKRLFSDELNESLTTFLFALQLGRTMGGGRSKPF